VTHELCAVSLLPFCATVTSVTITVTAEALVLCPLLEDRKHITDLMRYLVPVDRMKPNVFRSRRNKTVDRSSFSSVGSLFHARDAAKEKALSPVRRRVHGTTMLPHDEARSVDRPGILKTDIRRSEIYSGVCTRSDL